jgi:cell division protein FtsI/penicillin-binding protein 2
MLHPNRFALKVNDTAINVKPAFKLAEKPEYAALLKQYMIAQSAPKVPILHIAVAGKSGTPERIVKNQSVNDGWYVFFAPEAKGTGNMVVCIRIESTRGSSDAVRLAGNHVIPFLLKKGYIKSFEPEKKIITIKAPPAEEINLPEDTAATTEEEQTNP